MKVKIMKRALVFSGNLQNVGDLALLLQCAYGLRQSLGIDEIIVRQWGPVHEDVARQLVVHRISVLNGKKFIAGLRLVPKSLVLFGGGQLIRDNTSLASTFAIGLLIWCAEILQGRTAAVGCGASEIKKPFHRLLWKAIVGRLRFFGARDANTVDTVKAFGANIPIHLTADLIHLPSPLTVRLTENQKDNLILVAPCQDFSEDRSISSKTVAAVVHRYQQIKGQMPTILVCHDSRPGMDPIVADAIQKELQTAGIQSDIFTGYVLDEFLDRYKDAGLVVTNRLHSLFFAALARKPIILIDDGNRKTRAPAEALDIPMISAASTSEQITAALEYACASETLAGRKELLDKMGIAAQANFDLMRPFL